MSLRYLDFARTAHRAIATSHFGRLAAAVDEKTGIIQRVNILRNAAEDPRLFCAVAQPASLVPVLGYTFDNRGGACALTSSRAAVRACGECIERYSSAFYEPSTLLRATSSELLKCGRPHYPTSAFYSFTPEQYRSPGFPFNPVDDGSLIRWVETTDYHSKQTVYVPASCVYMPYLFHDEPVTHAPISTGLAAGISASDCIEKGAAEIVERDSLMISWKCCSRVPGIHYESCIGIDRDADALLRSTSHLAGRWFIHLLTRDIEVPVVSAAFIMDDGPPLTSFGISAHRDPIAALCGALEEALLSRFLINRSAEVVNSSDGHERTYRTLRDHLFGHAISQSMKQSFFEVFDLTPTLTFKDVCKRFELSPSVIDAVRDAHLRVLCCDVTSEDVGSIGIRSFRVLIPTAEPLDPDHDTQHLGGRRLNHANRSGGSFNASPHPFP